MIRAKARILFVGVGGIGCPAALALARAGVGTIGLCDDDEVERSNLHRQILFSDAEVGMPKVEAAAGALTRIAPEIDFQLHKGRLLPDGAAELVREYDMVLEGADNFATKFLVADACLLARTPVVHASAVRWIGTVLAVGSAGRPCYRCLFEEMPPEGAAGCAEAGVMGPILGVVAAAQVDLGLAILEGKLRNGELVTFDGRSDILRRRAISRRVDCPLCGDRPGILSIRPEAYLTPALSG